METKVKYICIIDDDPIHVFTTKKMLKIYGYTGEFIVYENGKVAYDGLVESNVSPDVILLDINMPVMNGWEFLTNLSKKIDLASVPPIFIMTSSIDAEDKKKAKGFVVVKDFISKPFDLGKVTEFMCNLELK
jgi:CheY-like chemotaxis protein